MSLPWSCIYKRTNQFFKSTRYCWLHNLLTKSVFIYAVTTPLITFLTFCFLKNCDLFLNSCFLFKYLPLTAVHRIPFPSFWIWNNSHHFPYWQNSRIMERSHVCIPFLIIWKLEFIVQIFSQLLWDPGIMYDHEMNLLSLIFLLFFPLWSVMVCQALRKKSY